MFRVTPRHGKHDLVSHRLEAAVEQASERLELAVREVSRQGGKKRVFDVTSSLYEILGKDELTVEDIEKRLQGFIEPLLVSLQD